MHASRLLLLLLSILLAAGCSSPEAGGGEAAAQTQPPEATSRLQVIVWSTASRRAVGATGTVATAGQSYDLDTRSSFQDGQLFADLTPGLYTIDVDTRYEEGKAFRVTGSENVYLEPGAQQEVTVVALDRPGNN